MKIFMKHFVLMITLSFFSLTANSAEKPINCDNCENWCIKKATKSKCINDCTLNNQEWCKFYENWCEEYSLASCAMENEMCTIRRRLQEKRSQYPLEDCTDFELCTKKGLENSALWNHETKLKCPHILGS